MQNELIRYLSSFLTPERLLLFNRVVNQRTNYLTVVLEDIFQPQNASAVLRSCDCFGIQNVHVIENWNTFTVDREVAMGASKWIDIHRYNQLDKNTPAAVKALKKKGYRIVATSPHINEQLLPDFDISKGKAALVFGSEFKGLSNELLDLADEFIKIPMFGFTESFNISVSAAVVLQHLTHQLRNTKNLNWQLTDQEKEEVKLSWIRKSVKSSKLLEEHFYSKKR